MDLRKVDDVEEAGGKVDINEGGVTIISEKTREEVQEVTPEVGVAEWQPVEDSISASVREDLLSVKGSKITSFLLPFFLLSFSSIPHPSFLLLYPCWWY